MSRKREPRKQPAQERSRETYAAIVEAASRILDKGEPLTTTRLAEVAGVSVGSLYQYFPNREAVAAALVEHLLARDRAFVADVLESVQPPLIRSFETVFSRIVHHQLAESRVLAALLPMLPDLERDGVAEAAFDEMSVLFARRLLDFPEALRADLRDDPAALRLACRVVAHGVRGVLNAMTRRDPEVLRDPRLMAEVVRMGSILLADQPSTRA